CRAWKKITGNLSQSSMQESIREESRWRTTPGPHTINTAYGFGGQNKKARRYGVVGLSPCQWHPRDLDRIQGRVHIDTIQVLGQAGSHGHCFSDRGFFLLIANAQPARIAPHEPDSEDGENLWY